MPEEKEWIEFKPLDREGSTAGSTPQSTVRAEEAPLLLEVRSQNQADFESNSAASPTLKWVEGVSVLPWPEFTSVVSRLAIYLLIVPITFQLLWMNLFKKVHDVQYYPVSILFCLAGTYCVFRDLSVNDKLEKDEPDHLQKGPLGLRVYVRWVIITMAFVLFDALLYPWGFLSHVQWHYERCQLTCSSEYINSHEATQNVTFDFCQKGHRMNRSQAWFPVYSSNGKIYAPQLLWFWVYEDPVEDVAKECVRIAASDRASKAVWKLTLGHQPKFVHFFVQMTMRVGISKVEVYGPVLGGMVLTLLAAAIKVEQFKIHQVGWARAALLNQIKKRSWSKVKTMAEKMVDGVPEEDKVPIIAQLFGIAEAKELLKKPPTDGNSNAVKPKEAKENDNSNAVKPEEATEDDNSNAVKPLTDWRDHALALFVAIFHSTMAGIWRTFWMRTNRHFFPFAAKYMWWLVMAKIIVAQSAILYIGYLWNIYTIRVYECERTLYLLFQEKWPLQQTFQVQRSDTETVQVQIGEYKTKDDARARGREVFKVKEDWIQSWLDLQELILLSTIVPRTSQALHLCILIAWFAVIVLCALSNFVLEWPREFDLHTSDVIALIDFVLIGYLIHKGFVVYIELEKLKQHDYESLEVTWWELELDTGKDDVVQLMRTRMYDLSEGRYAVKKSSALFNDSNFKKASLSILAAIGAQGGRLLINFFTSSLDQDEGK